MSFAPLRLLLLSSLAALTVPAWAGEQISALQLDRLLDQASGKPDASLVKQLAGVELTERLSSEHLARCQARLAGAGARQQLLALADAAAFLSLPAEELPDLPAPPLDQQRSMLALTVKYVTTSMHQLPNFTATRTTSSYQRGAGKAWSLHSRSGMKVLYRGGEEVPEKSGALTAAQGLITSGEFGPTLGTVMLDAAQSNLSWSHWEQESRGRQAVFRFSVPVKRSHYQLSFCCVVSLDRLPAPYRAYSAYHGEIVIDPATGVILRLVLRADLKHTDPLARADLFVEYGPIEIGGKNYICPIRGAAYSVGGWSELGTWLNDIVFDQYHVFASTVRILPGRD